MKKWIYVVLVLGIAGIGGFSVHAASSAHEKHLNVSRMNVDDEFKDTDGTFILHDLQKDQTFVYNRKRANQRQTPQSTFKVVNALIGLQVKAVRDEYDVNDGTGSSVNSNHGTATIRLARPCANPQSGIIRH